MKKVIVACFALAVVVSSASVEAQLFGRFRNRRSNNCCCQPASCESTSAAAGEVVSEGFAVEAASSDSYAVASVGEVAPVSYEAAPMSYEGSVGDCGCGGEVGPVSYEAPVEMAPAGDCGGCGEVSQMSYEGQAIEGQAIEGAVFSEGEPTLAVQGADTVYDSANSGEVIISEEIVSEEAVEPSSTVESPATEAASEAPATAPAAEDSVPAAPATEGDA